MVAIVGEKWVEWCRLQDTSFSHNSTINDSVNVCVLFASTLIASTWVERTRAQAATMCARECVSLIFYHFDSRKCNVCLSFLEFSHSGEALIFLHRIKCADERHLLLILLLLLFVGAIKLRRRQVYTDFWAIRLCCATWSECACSPIKSERRRRWRRRTFFMMYSSEANYIVAGFVWLAIVVTFSFFSM